MHCRGHDTYEDEQRDTVGYAVFRDTFANPHGEHASADKHNGDVDVHYPVVCLEEGCQANAVDDDTVATQPCVVDVTALVFQRKHDAYCTENSKTKGYPTGNFVEFFPTFFAFLGHSRPEGIATVSNCTMMEALM